MSIQESELLSSVRERDVDLVIVQLLKTEPSFRKWFADQIGIDLSPVDFLGVRHSVERETGESDIEVGFETATGKRCLVLVENKINATKQNRQVERYFKRGENYVDRKDWETFRVALTAPEDYVSDADRNAFEDIITYEDLLDRIERGHHDGREFLRAVLEGALEKRELTDLSYWTEMARQHFEGRVDSLPPVEVYPKGSSNKHLRVRSQDPDHPEPVLYNVYFPGGEDGKKAVVRINLTENSTRNFTAEEFESLQPILNREVKRLDGFKSFDKQMYAVKSTLRRSKYQSDEEYIENVTEMLCELIETYHPVLVAEETP